MKRLRAVIYARVSSDRQRTDRTILTQLRTLPKWIEQQGWDHVGTYEDEGKSASPGKLHLRGSFQQLLLDCAQDKFDVVVVVDLDRITRTNDWSELGQIFGPFQKHGIAIAGPGLSRPVKIGEGMSDFELMMRIKISYEENQTRVSKFLNGKVTVAQMGGHVASACPYGLGYKVPEDKIRDGRGWYKVPEQAAIVEQIYERVVAGESGHSIAKDLEQRGVPSPNGGRWLANALPRIVRSPVYRGIYRWRTYTIPVPAIVSDETWFKAQAALAPSQKRGIGRPLGYHLCHGLAVCSACGSPIYVCYKPGKKYQCRDNSHRRPADRSRCKLPTMDQERMDALIWDVVRRFLCRPPVDVLADLRGTLMRHDAEVKAWASDVEKYAAAIDELNKREQGVIKVAMEMGMDPANLRDQLAANQVRRLKLQEQLNAAQAAVSASSSSVTAALDLERLVVQLAQVAERADEKQRRDLVRALVPPRGIVLDHFGANVTLRFTQGQPGAEVPDISQGNCVGSMVKDTTQLPGENVVVLRVVR